MGEIAADKVRRETKRIFLTVAALILLLASPAKAQQQAYIWDGNSMQPVTDTRNLVCQKWSIWLFTSDDHSKVPGQQWGAIIRESESDVMDQLKDAQDIEDQIIAGAGNGQLAWLTYHNYIGPICNVKPPNPDANDALDQLESLGNRLDKAYSMIQELWPTHKSALEEQMNQLMETIQRVNKLRNDLEQRNRSAMMTINASIDEIIRNTDTLESKSQQITHRFGSGTNVAAKPPATSTWSRQQVNVLGSNISQNIQVNGSQVQVSQLAISGSNGQGQSYSFSTQSLDSGSIRVQSQGGIWVVSLGSTSRNVSLRIANGAGAVTNEVVSTVSLYFSSQAQAQAAANSFSQLAGR
jgi:hypothetical protein